MSSAKQLEGSLVAEVIEGQNLAVLQQEAFFEMNGNIQLPQTTSACFTSVFEQRFTSLAGNSLQA